MANTSPLFAKNREAYFVDDIIRRWSETDDEIPIFGYPKYKNNPAEYEFLTVRELNCMVDGACRALVRYGYQVNGKRVIGLYAQTDLSYVITFFALFRLGYKVLVMSIRLNSRACLNLLEKAHCDIILHGNTDGARSVLNDVSTERPGIKLQPLLQRCDFDMPSSGSHQPFHRPIPNPDKESAEVALIAHSSGSTGLPKPLNLSHRSILSNMHAGTELKSFNGLPCLQAMWLRKTACLFNACLPLTADNIISALKTIGPEVCHFVPYTLAVIAQEPEGVELLRRCQYVTCSGAKLEDKLGDWLVENGVNLVLIYGLTEVGHVGKSVCENRRDSWAYIRPYAHTQAHISFQKVSEDLYESVYLKSHPALLGSEDFRSGDLFTPHPTIPNAWKFVARRDDRVTLSNGEKFFPFAMESTIRSNPFVLDALIVGNNRPVPGLLVFRTEEARQMVEEDFIDAIWTDVKHANALVDNFAHLTRDMIVSIPPAVDYPKTDKHNIIRAACQAAFESQIENLYTRWNDGNISEWRVGQKLELDVMQLERFIMDIFKTHANITLRDVTQDFFAAGVDSLRAIQVRNLLSKYLKLGWLPTNLIYDARTTEGLARALLSDSTVAEPEVQDWRKDIERMKSFIQEFSRFNDWVQGAEPMPAEDTVLLTGATGAIGAHILQQLLYSPRTQRVVCLVRGSNGLDRIFSSIKSRGIDVNKFAYSRKLMVIRVDDFGALNLGIPLSLYNNLIATTTLVIHAAWPVHFGLSLASFEPHIAGLHSLLKLSLSVPFKEPARFLFASSISAALNTPQKEGGPPVTVPEGPVDDLTYAHNTGYGRSKLVSERVCEAAAQAGGVVGVLRIGQVTGDTSHGIWNDHEAIPLMVRSALEVKALPLLHGGKDRCEWLPVDMVATACLDLAEWLKMSSRDPELHTPANKAFYYHITAPQAVSWNKDVLPALREYGLKFQAVPFDDWIERLKALVDYYTQEYGGASMKHSGLQFETKESFNRCRRLRNAPSVVQAGLLEKYFRVWVKNWRE
ncbi:NRPS-like enzyme [Mariannaea sp. PMI_226]|nr:NRPS-like enzyme [Mariannaea sp. PMI_226]